MSARRSSGRIDRPVPGVEVIAPQPLRSLEDIERWWGESDADITGLVAEVRRLRAQQVHLHREYTKQLSETDAVLVAVEAERDALRAAIQAVANAAETIRTGPLLIRGDAAADRIDAALAAAGVDPSMDIGKASITEPQRPARTTPVGDARASGGSFRAGQVVPQQPTCEHCGHEWERHGPEAPGCIECRCRRPGPVGQDTTRRLFCFRCGAPIESWDWDNGTITTHPCGHRSGQMIERPSGDTTGEQQQ